MLTLSAGRGVRVLERHAGDLCASLALAPALALASASAPRPATWGRPTRSRALVFTRRWRGCASARATRRPRRLARPRRACWWRAAWVSFG